MRRNKIVCDPYFIRPIRSNWIIGILVLECGRSKSGIMFGDRFDIEVHRLLLNSRWVRVNTDASRGLLVLLIVVGTSRPLMAGGYGDCKNTHTQPLLIKVGKYML
jgi:hypothetical protein